MASTPTEEVYSEFLAAHKFFNDALFDGALLPPLFTLQRKQNTVGYYSPKRFLRRDARGKSDEIALNPQFFAYRTLEQTLSTLVHEMVHQWQVVFGKPCRRGYHDREWAAKMESVGLMPSHTGAVGGNRVGQQMTHYIMLDGPFDMACKTFIAGGGGLSWVDLAAKKVRRHLPTEPAGEPDGDDQEPDDPSVDLTALKALGMTPVEPEDKKLKIKYSCPCCTPTINVWGKPGLKILCGECGVGFEASNKRAAPAVETPAN